MASGKKAKAPVSTETSVSTGPVVTLAEVVEATKANSFVYTSPEFHTALVESGDVEINPEITDPNGNIATRATEKAMNPMTDPVIQTDPVTAPVVDTPVAVKAKPTFEIKKGEIPEKVRAVGASRAGRTPVYPFDQLEVGEYFFVPNDPAAKAVAAKSLASSVAGANERYSEVIEGETRKNRKGNVVPATKPVRKFKIYDTVETVDGVEVKGAKIFRVKLEG